MPNYTEFEGIDLITDPTKKVIGEILIKNELGGVSNGYQLDHAGTSNSGYSFGGNQMDIGTASNGGARNLDARVLFENIITHELGQNFLDSIKDRAYSNGNSDALTTQEKSQINSALSSIYAKPLINESFVNEVNTRSSHIDNFANFLNTTFTDDVKIALVDYDNQFGLSFDTSKPANMTYKLQNILNQNGVITLEDIENSVRSTGYYQDLLNDNKKGNAQESRIQTTREIIEDAGLISDGSTSSSSLKNSLTTTLATITVTADREAAAKSWFETFSDSLDSWTGSAVNFMKEAASDVINFFSSPSESLSKIGGWISSAFTSGASEQAPDPSKVDNSLLDLDIRTDKLKGFSSNQDITQTGNVIGDGDWEVKMPINVINGDGYKNVADALSFLFKKNFEQKPQNISFAAMALIFLTLLFPLSTKAGVVEDVINEKKIDISKAEERCRLADELTKIVHGFNKRIKGYYQYHEVCDGEEYEVINGKVIAGMDKKTSKHAKCNNYRVKNFYVFHDRNKEKYYAVSRGFDGMYVIAIDEAIDEGDANSTIINGGSVIVKKSEPKEKISYRYIKNCDVLIEQKINKSY